MRYENDKALSIRAKGVLRIIENAFNGQEGKVPFHFEMLEGKEGRDAKRNAIKELIRSGYLRQVFRRNEVGQIDGSDYFVKYAKGE